uniref:Epoxide hydrolase n=1 Tax=Caenorhabditis japonica TaxID=281687 RepID=A0A8R1DVM1_CAEJA
MGITKLILAPVAIGVLLAAVWNFIPAAEIVVEENNYYGTGKVRADNTEIKPFKVHVEQSVIDDLKQRLTNSRISHVPLEDSDDFYYGFNAKHLLKLRDYWLNKYDWKKQEALLNQFPQFTTQIEGLQVHFLRVQPPKSYKNVKPLLMAHGWPGTVFEFYKIIPILTDPKKHGIDSDFAFEVIAPSIPGYGWSEQPKKTGFSQLSCARVFRKLMLRLGYEKFYLQGGDWGAVVTSLIAKIWPQNVAALHLNMLIVVPGRNVLGTLHDFLGWLVPSTLSSEALRKSHNPFARIALLIVESGYMHLQATKPDTVGTSLNDSPIGLAAYIIEKFSTWTNADYRALLDGGLNKKFTNDELLTMVMIYWTNGNIVSSQRFYREFFIDRRIDQLGKRYVSVPTGHASGINELFDRTPLEVSRHSYNVTHYTEIDMGHFAAFEAPKPLAASVFKFIKDLH